MAALAATAVAEKKPQRRRPRQRQRRRPSQRQGRQPKGASGSDSRTGRSSGRTRCGGHSGDASRGGGSTNRGSDGHGKHTGRDGGSVGRRSGGNGGEDRHSAAMTATPDRRGKKCRSRRPPHLPTGATPPIRPPTSIAVFTSPRRGRVEVLPLQPTPRPQAAGAATPPTVKSPPPSKIGEEASKTQRRSVRPRRGHNTGRAAATSAPAADRRDQT